MESQVTTADSMNFTETINNVLTNMFKTAGPDRPQVENIPERFRISWDDATWVLTSSFIIFTMQSGFGLLEAGCVSSKNEVNILVKNAIDVVFGGITYWAFGYGLSFGMDKGSNPFCGVGYWFVEDNDPDTMGAVYATFIFQLSFATTATTIVSGAMAERTKLRSYISFSLINTVIYCIPAHWVWAENGFLASLGVVDVAGSGCVHLLGGTSAFVAAAMLGPRIGRYDNGHKRLPLGNGTNVLLGMFMLWWGWLAFNSGSTFGISGGKWILAARTSVTTLNASMGGGVVGIIYTCVMNKGKMLVTDIATAILGALVSITASCALVRPWEAVVIGSTGALLCLLSVELIDKIQVDDPVSAIAVHGTGGAWGMLAVGIFVDLDRIEDFSRGQKGISYGGGFYLLGIQALAIVCIISWTVVATYSMLAIIRLIMGLRLSQHEEELGSDYVEHAIPRVKKSTYARLQQELGLLGLNNGVDKSISVLICQLHNISKENQKKLRLLRPSDKTLHHDNGDIHGTVNGVGNHIPDTDILRSEQF